MLDRLQDAGLVERRANPTDRRAWRVFLTANGEGLLEKLRPFGGETIDAALDGVSHAEREQLIATLDRVRTNLSRRAPSGLAANG